MRVLIYPIHLVPPKDQGVLHYQSVTIPPNYFLLAGLVLFFSSVSLCPTGASATIASQYLIRVVSDSSPLVHATNLFTKVCTAPSAYPYAGPSIPSKKSNISILLLGVARGSC